MKKQAKKNLSDHHAYYEADDAFAGSARLLQSLWAQKQNLPLAQRQMSLKDGSVRALPPLRNYVELDYATNEGSNFLSDTIRDVVRKEMEANEQRKGLDRKIIRPDRLYGNLLSSQPLAFNLFGELKTHRGLATRVFKQLFPERINEVTKIEFEYSPGRGNVKFTEDRSAFDVFVEYKGPKGKGFLGVEVKYAENMNVAPAKFRDRYREVAEAAGVFAQGAVNTLCSMPKPIEQLWRDHLLCLSMQPPVNPAYDAGAFVFLYPKDNRSCYDAVQAYAKNLESKESFLPITMEAFCDALRAQNAGDWVKDLHERYLDFDRIAASAV